MTVVKFALPAITLVNGDCFDYLPDVPSKSIDCVTTSPPYNLGIAYASHDDTAPRREYLDWCEDWLGAVKRVLKDDGSFFLNVGGKPTSPMGPYDVMGVARNYFVLQNDVTWCKSITIKDAHGVQISAGHFKPLNTKRFLNDTHEFLWHFTKTGDVKVDRLAVGVPYADVSNVARFGTEGRPNLRCRGNVWFCPYETVGAEGKPHPAAFPERLVEMCYLLAGAGSKALTTLDCFLGSGTSAVVAARMGLSHIGIEKDAGYFEAAVMRVGSELAKIPGATVRVEESSGRVL